MPIQSVLSIPRRFRLVRLRGNAQASLIQRFCSLAIPWCKAELASPALRQLHETGESGVDQSVEEFGRSRGRRYSDPYDGTVAASETQYADGRIDIPSRCPGPESPSASTLKMDSFISSVGATRLSWGWSCSLRTSSSWSTLLRIGPRDRRGDGRLYFSRTVGKLALCNDRQIETHCGVAWPSLLGRPEAPDVASLLPWAKPARRSCAQAVAQDQDGPTTTVQRQSRRPLSSSRTSAAPELRPPSIISIPTRRKPSPSGSRRTIFSGPVCATCSIQGCGRRRRLGRATRSGKFPDYRGRNLCHARHI